MQRFDNYYAVRRKKMIKKKTDSKTSGNNQTDRHIRRQGQDQQTNTKTINVTRFLIGQIRDKDRSDLSV